MDFERDTRERLPRVIMVGVGPIDGFWLRVGNDAGDMDVVSFGGSPAVGDAGEESLTGALIEDAMHYQRERTAPNG